MEWYLKGLAIVVVYILLWKFFFHRFVSEMIARENGGVHKTAAMARYDIPLKKTGTYWTLLGCNILYYLSWLYVIIVAIVIIFKS